MLMRWHLNCIERYAGLNLIHDWNEVAEVENGVSSLGHCCPYGKCGTNRERSFHKAVRLPRSALQARLANSMTKRNNTSLGVRVWALENSERSETWGLPSVSMRGLWQAFHPSKSPWNYSFYREIGSPLKWDCFTFVCDSVSWSVSNSTYDLVWAWLYLNFYLTFMIID